MFYNFVMKINNIIIHFQNFFKIMSLINNKLINLPQPNHHDPILQNLFHQFVNYIQK